ncbi:MAG TPA: alpha/beta hydrolase [Polyangia bacterium]
MLHKPNQASGRGAVANFHIKRDTTATGSCTDRFTEFPTPTSASEPLTITVATVIASGDDPYVAIDRARAFARAWRAEFVAAGAAGHLNAASGLRDWPAGRRALDALLARAAGASPGAKV